MPAKAVFEEELAKLVEYGRNLKSETTKQWLYFGWYEIYLKFGFRLLQQLREALNANCLICRTKVPSSIYFSWGSRQKPSKCI